ncbi:MAG: hypothetical protein RLZZ224_1897 [Verrucomicrobiota bacterium]
MILRKAMVAIVGEFGLSSGQDMAAGGHSWSSKRRKPRFYKRKGFWVGIFLLSILAAVGAVMGWEMFLQYSKPYRERAMTYDLERINDLEVPSIILDRNDQEIGRIFVENRSLISYEEIPPSFIQALKAGEDSRFDRHRGIDYIGIARAGLKMISNRGEVTQGASTITQQLARDAYGLKAEARQRKESGFQRKFVEMFLAQRIEERYSKKEILGFFVNRSFLGSGYYGLRSAALGYFGKEPKDLSIPECASIVTILRNPFEISPLNNIDVNKRGRDHVLRRMHAEGMISMKELTTFLATPVQLNPKPLKRGTSHVYELIAAEARHLIGEDAFARGGLVIRTTLIKSVQDAAQDALEKSLVKVEAQEGYKQPKKSDYKRGSGATKYVQGALLMVDHETGEVLAYLGGRDHAHSQYNFIEEGRKPMGTALFPFLVASGFEKGLTPATAVEDEPMDNRSIMVGGREGILGEWGAEIAQPRYQGEIPIRRALEQSKVAAMVRFGTKVGVDRMADGLRAFGFDVPASEVLPRLLVGSDAASLPQAVSAIATFARSGETGARQATYVTRIDDNHGQILIKRTAEPSTRRIALNPATAYQVHDMLRGTMRDGNLKGQLDDMPASFQGAVKTGSTFDFSGCWSLGYSSRVSCGVWCGFFQGGAPAMYEGAFGKDIALPIWKAAMQALPKKYLQGEIRRPSSLEEIDVCRVSGMRATPHCYESVAEEGQPAKLRDARRKELFRTGTESIASCHLHTAALAGGSTPIRDRGADLTVTDARPVHAREPLLIGNDPYQAEVPDKVADADDDQSHGIFFQSMENAFDNLNLGDEQAQLPLMSPGKLEIEIEID